MLMNAARLHAVGSSPIRVVRMMHARNNWIAGLTLVLFLQSAGAASIDAGVEGLTDLAADAVGCDNLLDPAFGCILWKETSRPIVQARAGAAAFSPDGTRVFAAFQSETPGFPALMGVRALDARSGATLWTTQGLGAGSALTFVSSIAVSPDGNTVAVAGVSQLPGGSRLQLAALAAATGSVLWTQTGGLVLSSATETVSFSADSQSVLVAFSDWQWTPNGLSTRFVVLSLEATTGIPAWTFLHGGLVRASLKDVAMAPDRSILYLHGTMHVPWGPSQATTAAIDTATGTLNWLVSVPLSEADPASYGWGIDVGPDGTIYASADSSRGIVMALDPHDGSRLWTRDLPSQFLGTLQVFGDGQFLLVGGAERTTSTIHLVSTPVAGLNATAQGTMMVWRSLDAASGQVLVEYGPAPYLQAVVTGDPHVPSLYITELDDASPESVPAAVGPVSNQGGGLTTRRVDARSGQTQWSSKVVEAAGLAPSLDEAIMDPAGTTLVVTGTDLTSFTRPWAFTLAYASDGRPHLAGDPTLEIHCKAKTTGHPQAKCRADVQGIPVRVG